MFKFIKRMFCKHSWEPYPSYLTHPTLPTYTFYFKKQCTKCEKIVWDETKVVLKGY